MHCTTVSRRCTTDESYSREVCMADFLLKNMPRNIHTKLLNHIISFSLHNFKAILVQQCLPDYFFFLGCILISPAMHFCLLSNGSSRNILLLFLTITYFYKDCLYPFLMARQLSWTTSLQTDIGCFIFLYLFQSHVLHKFLAFWCGQHIMTL